MRKVYEGEQVMLEWKPIVDLLVSEFLTRSNGELMVHNPEKFIIPVNSGYRVWFFSVINPWLDRFNKILFTYKESGIHEVWTKRAWRYFSQKYIKQFQPLPLPQNIEKDDFHKMSMADLLGNFLMLIIFTGFSIIVLMIEMVFADQWKRIQTFSMSHIHHMQNQHDF